MDGTPTTAQRIIITGAATELGLEACRHFSANGAAVTGLVPDETLAERVRATGAEAQALDLANTNQLAAILTATQPEIVLHLALQRANTLLHDGQKWRGYQQTLPAETSSLLQAIQRGATNVPAPLLIYGSYAFLYGDARDATESAPLTAGALDPAFAAAIHAEEQVRAGATPTAVLRLGYLYGPDFKDLALYVKAFRLHRLYWSGPKSGLANYLHVEDAARALALVAQNKPAGKVFNVVDGSPASFADFLDYFAKGYGFQHPRHVPTWSGRLARRFITIQHMRQTALVTTVNSDAFRQRFNWAPRYPDYRAGLDEAIRRMQAKGVIKNRG